jgi:hypothetical protein
MSFISGRPCAVVATDGQHCRLLCTANALPLKSRYIIGHSLPPPSGLNAAYVDCTEYRPP